MNSNKRITDNNSSKQEPEHLLNALFSTRFLDVNPPPAFDYIDQLQTRLNADYELLANPNTGGVAFGNRNAKLCFK